MVRTRWHSRVGFIAAAAGSAIGLANIWRFPYIVGAYGGAAFIAIYLFFLLLVGLPIFVAEVLLGRSTHLTPVDAFASVGGSSLWRWCGCMVLLTGVVVSCFYSVVAGWILGYLLQAIYGALNPLTNSSLASEQFNALMSSPFLPPLYHTLFMGASGFILFFGVQKGLERGSKVLLPLLFIMLLFVVGYAMTLPGAWEGLLFLLRPDWTVITPTAMLTALGHAFFTLSLGQGTMVTYGSYVADDEELLTPLIWTAVMDTLVSLLAAAAIIAIVFSASVEPTSGPCLLFITLPPIFASVMGGQWLAVAFFSLVTLAALTSQISAMEPSIAYLRERFGWGRHKSVAAVTAVAWSVGLVISLSTGPLAWLQIGKMNLLEFFSYLASDIMIPLGGLAVVLLVAWRWGVDKALDELFHSTSSSTWLQGSWMRSYLRFCLKFSAPVLIVFVFLFTLGVFSFIACSRL